MFDWLSKFLELTDNLLPHGSCYLWQSSLVWLHVVSDSIITLSYFSIPFGIVYLVKKREDLVFSYVILLFGTFILLCGLTHILSIVTVWSPIYWLEGFIKAITAIVSIWTACVFWWIMPSLLELPSSAAYRTKTAFLDSIFNASPDALIITDHEGKIIRVNHQTTELLGLEADKVIGQQVSHYFHDYEFRLIDRNKATHFNPFENLSEKIICKHSLVNLQTRSIIEVEIRYCPIQTAQGQFFAHSIRDVTEQRKIENLLKESEHRFRSIANQSIMMIWTSDTHGNFTFLNESWQTFTGIHKEALTFEEWFELVHPDDRQMILDNKEKTARLGSLISSEYRFLCNDGTWRWVLDTSKSKYEHGVHVGFVGSSIDITKRKEDEVQLSIAAAAFETQEPLIITDSSSTILKANQAFLQMSGFELNEIIGKKISLLRSGIHDEEYYERLWAAVQETGNWQGEIIDRRKNGELFPVWLTITAVINEFGETTHYVGTFIDITERKIAQEEINKLAFYDPLTKLPNRRLLQERLNHAIQRSDRENKLFALLMLDLDRFKQINDSLGYLAGDELLKLVASRIQSHLRAVDTVARYGGDEFVILLENIAYPEEANRIVERLLESMNKPYKIFDHNEIWIGTSAGITLFPQLGLTEETLMSQADAALYKAKEQGRGCIIYYSEEFNRLAHERIMMEGRLRKAINQNELRVYYQPQVDIKTNRIIGAEALVRWQDPIEGLIPPGKFIPLAEETHLIDKISEWVLKETCRQGKEWLDAGIEPLTLAVNISPRQFGKTEINDLVTLTLSDTGFPASLLELEITESGLMKNGEIATQVLTYLHDHDIRLSIDDFGTGYSSLAYLRHFPLDVIKIDKSFVDDIPDNKEGMEIVATIIVMGHALGFKVIAEGVETQNQLDFLREKGCDYYQGYLKSKPIPADEFIKFLLKTNRSNNLGPNDQQSVLLT